MTLTSGREGLMIRAGANVHIYPSPLTHESRIEKIATSLAKIGLFERIIVIGRKASGLARREAFAENIAFWRCGLMPSERLYRGSVKLMAFVLWHISVPWALRGVAVRQVNCHSLSVLPLCVWLKWRKSARLIYDTHELETEVASQRGLRKSLIKLTERWLIGQAEHVITVSAPIADWYRKTYQIDNVSVIRNMPPRMPRIKQKNTQLLRTACSIDDPQAVLFLYQGLFLAGRGIEIALQAFRVAPPSHHLVFLGYGAMEKTIKRVAASAPNIHILPPVPSAELAKYTCGADVGLCLFENVSLSYYYCAPNKLYQYAMGGVPVLGSDFPEIRAFMRKHDCGWVCPPNLKELQSQLAKIDAAEIAAKKASLRDNKRDFCWENEEQKLLDLYKDIA